MDTSITEIAKCNGFDALIDLYEAWIDANADITALEPQSADELLHELLGIEPRPTKHIEWVTAFIARWQTVNDLDTLKYLANKAKPETEDDWGSERQIDAENYFYNRFEDFMGGIPEHYEDWALKATLEERLTHALELAAKKIAQQ